MASPREKRITLVAAILGSGIVFLDATVVNIALPAIRGDLGGGLAGQQWVVEAYLLTLSALLLIGGAVGGNFGAGRPVFVRLAGVGVFSVVLRGGPPLGGLFGFPGVLGAALGAIALAGPVLGLTEQPVRGWDNLVVGSIAVGVVAGALFVLQERRSSAPMMPLELFSHRNFSIGNLATLTTYMGLGAMTFLLPLFLQQVSHYTPVKAGLP